MKPQKESKKEKKVNVHDNVYDNASGIYNMYQETYFNQYMALSDNKKRKLGSKYDPVNLFFKIYNYDDWLKNEELVDKEESVDLPHMQPLECDEKLKKGKGLKSLTPKKLLIRLPILLAQIKAGKNSYKFLKNQTNITSIVSTQ